MRHPGLNTESLKRQAQAQFQSRRVNEARALFAEACRLDPADAQTWHMLGVCCAMLGDFNEAERCCRKTIELKPEVPVAHTNLANVLVSQGRLEEAVNVFQHAVKLGPRDVQAHVSLGNLLMRLERLAEAETRWREATRLDPACAEAHSNLGALAWRDGRLEEAEACYRRALQLEPGRAACYAALGGVLLAGGKRRQAQECYLKAVALAPELVEVHFQLGYLAREQGRLDDALAHFGRATAIKPDYMQARLGQAVTLQALGRMEEAIAVFHSMLGIKPGYENTITFPEIPATPPGEAADASAITIATSIAPRNIENQRLAVSSWKLLGFRVMSVNSADEIAVIKGHFPDVEFVVATRDAREEFGKPYVYFDDLLECLGKRGSAVCGIVNSDIHLRADAHFVNFLLAEAPGSFIFGCRIDVPSLESREGKPFVYGYDFFFFDKRFTVIYPREKFCMGLPWIDYWAVLVPALRNLPLKKLVTPVAYHVTHALNWNEGIRKSLNLAIARYLGAEQPPAERFVSLYSHYVHALIESRSREISMPDQGAGVS